MSFLWGSSQDSSSAGVSALDTVPSDTDHSSDMGDQQHMPLFALDQLKAAGVPIKSQMTPYLQMDPSIFRDSTPQVIMPEGYEHGRGKFEVALGFIGTGVAGAFATGSIRGFSSEVLFNRETLQLPAKPMFTRLTNATMKYGSGYAQAAGAMAFLYSLAEIALKSLRGADDALNSIAAGTATGALYRSPHGRLASAKGAIAGIVAGFCLELMRQDRERIEEILIRMRGLFRKG